MNNMQNEIMNAVISALGTILIALIGYVAKKTATYLDQKGITEKLNKKKYLVDIAVNAIEQIYQQEEGAVKLSKAKQEALRLLQENDLAISDTELQTFIESAVKAMNDGFNSTKDEVIERIEGGNK